MQEPDLIQIFTRRLNKQDICYMVTGAVASIIYGEPRLTNDIDMVVELKVNDVDKILGAFPDNEFYCPPAEIMKIEIGRNQRGHFNIIHHETGFKADVYLVGEDSLHHWAIANRTVVNVEGEEIWVAPPEYVIIRKLEYYKEGGSNKHLRDIIGIIEISEDRINFKELQHKIEYQGLQEVWNKIRKRK